MLEVLVVLAILSLAGMAAALGLPNARDRAKLAQAGAWLENMLADLRGQARREGRMHWVEFDVSTGRYHLQDTAWRALPSGATWALTHGRQADASPLITFLPDGTGSGAEISIRVGAYSSIRRVEWLTGSIRHAQR